MELRTLKKDLMGEQLHEHTVNHRQREPLSMATQL